MAANHPPGIRPTPPSVRPGTSARLAASLGSAFVVAATLAAAAYRARHVAPYRPVLERLSLPLPAEHAALAGLRLGLVTDSHVGPFISPDDLRRAAAPLAAERPDLLLLGGDYVAESPRYATAAADALRPLIAAAPLGAFAVLGNHDLANDAAKVTAALVAVGVTVLRNRAVPVDTLRGRLWLAGIDDAILGAPDPAATFAAIPPGAPVLALWHEPDWAGQTATLGAFAQLSGHSHGGQIRLPRLGALAVPTGGRLYPIGLNHAAGMPIYTSRGAGVYRPPVRFNCPPEVTLITTIASAHP